MIVVLVLVTFSEPLGIGAAVTPARVLDAGAEPFTVVPEGWLVPFADEALAAAPLREDDELGETGAVWCSSVD